MIPRLKKVFYTAQKNPPTGGLCLLSGKHTGILAHFQTKVDKKLSRCWILDA